MPDSPTFVLVHGMGCNAAVWGPTVCELALRGHRALAVDLAGHGLRATIPAGYLGPQDAGLLASEPSAMRGVGTADDVAIVVDVLRRAREHGPTVLVGTSRGGLTLNAVANTAPELVDRLVYASAHCPAAATMAEYGAYEEGAESKLASVMGIVTADPAAVGAIRLNWRTADPEMLDALQEAVLADGTRAELLAFLHHQDPDESIAIDDELVRARAGTWGTVPRTFVRFTEDRALPLALQNRLIAVADALTPDNPFDVHDLATSHVGFQFRPERFVALLDRLVGGRRTDTPTG